MGYTTVLDMTEESILKGNDYVSGNPRYLCIVKNFPTFFSFGPQLVTPDEVPDVLKLEVQSVHNGEVYAKNTVDHMTHKPARLVSLHSSIQAGMPEIFFLPALPVPSTSRMEMWLSAVSMALTALKWLLCATPSSI